MKKRVLSILLLLCVALTMLPAPGFSDEATSMPAETPECVCQAACAEGSLNAGCPVCGAQGATAEVCALHRDAQAPSQEGEAEQDAPVQDGEELENPVAFASEQDAPVQDGEELENPVAFASEQDAPVQDGEEPSPAQTKLTSDSSGLVIYAGSMIDPYDLDTRRVRLTCDTEEDHGSSKTLRDCINRGWVTGGEVRGSGMQTEFDVTIDLSEWIESKGHSVSGSSTVTATLCYSDRGRWEVKDKKDIDAGSMGGCPDGPNCPAPTVKPTGWLAIKCAQCGELARYYDDDVQKIIQGGSLEWNTLYKTWDWIVKWHNNEPIYDTLAKRYLAEEAGTTGRHHYRKGDIGLWLTRFWWNNETQKWIYASPFEAQYWWEKRDHEMPYIYVIHEGFEQPDLPTAADITSVEIALRCNNENCRYHSTPAAVDLVKDGIPYELHSAEVQMDEQGRYYVELEPPSPIGEIKSWFESNIDYGGNPHSSDWGEESYIRLYYYETAERIGGWKTLNAELPITCDAKAPPSQPTYRELGTIGNWCVFECAESWHDMECKLEQNYTIGKVQLDEASGKYYVDVTVDWEKLVDEKMNNEERIELEEFPRHYLVSVDAPEGPIRYYYDYNTEKWSTDYGKVLDPDTGRTKLVDIKIKVTCNAVTVRFDNNGGSGSMTDVTAASGTYILPECTFTAPEGHRFKGWSLNADGAVITAATIEVTENITLYAIWEQELQTVTISGVTLLNQVGGTEMTGSTKVYDGQAAAYDSNSAAWSPNLTDVTLTYTWQEMDEADYTDIAGNAAPSDAGSYRLLVTAKRAGNTIGTWSFRFTITKADGSGTVTITGWTYGDPANAPTANSTTNPGPAVIEYRDADKNVVAAPKNAGTYTVTASFPANDNYNAVTAETTFTITPKELTVKAKARDKVYDGGTGVAAGGWELVGAVANDDVFTLGSGYWMTFEDKNVGTDKTVYVSGVDGDNFKLYGTDAGNYTLIQPTQTKASITPRPLTITGVTVEPSKTYDGSTAAVITYSGEPFGVLSGDTVEVKAGTAVYSDKNVGTDKTVTFTGFTLAGEDAGNYTLSAQPQSVTASITPKELTVEKLAVADKVYDGTNTASISGMPELKGVVGTEDVNLVNGTPSFKSTAVGKDILISFTPFSLTGDDIGNYTLTQPSGITASITAYNADGGEYSVNSNDWLNVDFVVTAAEGWSLSYTNTAEGDWVDTLTVSEENNNGTLEFYLRNTTSGAISEKVTEHYKIDKTAPTGEVRIDERNAWQEFVNKVSFNLFYKDEQTVTITANDGGSGIAKREYLVTADDLTIEQLAEKTFTDYTGAFGIKPDAKLIVYARITDVAGNVTCLRSDGIVLDGTAPVINGADNGRTYCAAVTLTITDEYLASVRLNGVLQPPPTDGRLTLKLDHLTGTSIVAATDKAGNITRITVTVNDGHTWGDWTSNGDNTHTRTCKFDAEHTETDACHGGTATCRDRAVCEDCGAAYGQLLDHDWQEAWSRDADSHWHECTVCSEKKDVAEHLDNDADHLCDVCGWKMTEHNYTPEVAKEKYLLSAATCQSPAIYYRSCTICGAQGTETFEHGERNPNNHTGTLGDWQRGAENHWKVYSCCQAEALKAVHNGGQATCTEKAICEDCGAAYGQLLDHDWQEAWSRDADSHWHECTVCSEKKDVAAHDFGEEGVCVTCGYERAHVHRLTLVQAKEATCTMDGHTAYYTCSGCDTWFADAAGSMEITDKNTVNIPAGGHTFGSWQSDETDHWRECATCGEKTDKAPHEFKWMIDRQPTATENGSKHEECIICGYQRAAVKIPATDESKVPKTGDSSRNALRYALLASVLGLLGAAWLDKRKRVR